MLGSIFKSIVSVSALFLFVALLWQSSITDALPVTKRLVSCYGQRSNERALRLVIGTVGNNLVKSSGDDDDASRSLAVNALTGAPAVHRSLHSAVAQPSLIDRSPSLAHPRRLRKKIFQSEHRKSSSNLFQSAGTYNKNLRAAKRIKAALDYRLKRFRMLDQDEFQEMLKTMSDQTTGDEPSKLSNGMDTIGGMQLANYWSRK